VQYILHFPKLEPYVSLLVDPEAPQDLQRVQRERERLRGIVKDRVAAERSMVEQKVPDGSGDRGEEAVGIGVLAPHRTAALAGCIQAGARAQRQRRGARGGVGCGEGGSRAEEGSTSADEKPGGGDIKMSLETDELFAGAEAGLSGLEGAELEEVEDEFFGIEEEPFEKGENGDAVAAAACGLAADSGKGGCGRGQGRGPVGVEGLRAQGLRQEQGRGAAGRQKAGIRGKVGGRGGGLTSRVGTVGGEESRRHTGWTVTKAGGGAGTRGHRGMTQQTSGAGAADVLVSQVARGGCVVADKRGKRHIDLIRRGRTGANKEMDTVPVRTRAEGGRKRKRHRTTTST
jgi:hypothetical protein